MKKVCVDTNMLIWYIKKQCTQGQEDCLEKAEYLFDYLSSKGITTVIPSIVLAELLGTVDDDDLRETYFDFISANFEIVQFDILSSRKFIELKVKQQRNNADIYAKGGSKAKCEITNDQNICASAIASGCDTIFSHNLKDFEKFAGGQIQILTLDYVEVLKREAANNPRPEQVSLFDFAKDDDEDEDDDEDNPPF
jgi:predicted nucleic acid-binding protein